jgi:putative oxidoreductase
MTRNIYPEIAALVLRLATGIMLLAYGYVLKVLTYTPAGTAEFFVSIGYPAWLGYAVIAAEILGGILMILGIGTRYVALGLVPVMLGATLAHAGFGWSFSNDGGGWSFPAFWAVTLIVQALLDDGAFALGPRLAHSARRALQRHAAVA